MEFYIQKKTIKPTLNSFVCNPCSFLLLNILFTSGLLTEQFATELLPQPDDDLSLSVGGIWATAMTRTSWIWETCVTCSAHHINSSTPNLLLHFGNASYPLSLPFEEPALYNMIFPCFSTVQVKQK